ncbi:MAG: DNA polymerase II [Vulcanisaeta sp.]|jgi:DNA polymerase I|nr:DNA polymerase II [Vulcanisaeta sp.]MCG2866411.1 DNA polymerase II [Vulcanisaeta sp.]MCG2885318.1 DNA polymerase II [Vulcanisaeta sp.]MDT7969142.1 DNA polymerase II [Vulcanisaeta sp.]PVU72347.1 DNA polymerase II [Vulcanisaeta sp. SCGC AB-777_J10]
MELTFWLLDVTYGVVGNTPELRLFGITNNDKRVLVLDRSFRPYFYVLPSGDPSTVLANIKRKLEGRVLGVELVKRRLFGGEVDAIKVTATIPEKVRELREIAAEIPGVKDVLEADIRFSQRYLLDMGVKPSNWVVVDQCEEVKGNYQVDLVCLAKTRPRMIEEHKLPNFRIIALDIEVYNPRGMPNPDRDPIIIISTMTKEDGIKMFVADDSKNDAKIIREFVDYLRKYDPDIIVGYNNNGFDWPYLVNRSSRVGVKLTISRMGNPPEPSVYGHWSVIGRANVDLYNFIEEMGEIKVKSLDRAAEFLGVMRRDERVLIPGHRIYEYWDDKSKRDLLLRYARDDVVSTYGLAEKLLPFAIQLSSISGLPLDQVGASSVGARVEWMIFYEAVKRGELAPNREERPYETYKGAVVLEPRPGLHEDIAVIDFSSMYPSIMMKYNVSPDTLVIGDCNDCYVAPENNYRFRKTPEGLYPGLLRVLVESRRKVRELMKNYPENSPDWVLLNERQRALKVMANAMYGYCGWLGARWYRREVAEAVTAWGRNLLKTVIEKARSLGLPIIYGDTDSLFVKNIGDKVDALINYINNELGFDVKVDKVYRRVLFTEAKKRYVGLTIDGEVDIVGFEAVRGDWAEVAKDVQENVAEIVLKTGDVGKAVAYVKSIIDKLKAFQFDIDDVIIWKTLDKSLNEYKVLTPHVAAAKQLIEAGYKVGKGDMVGYVIVKGGGAKLAYKVKPYILIKDIREIDVDYYIEKQVIPAAMRILEVLGVKESQLMEGKAGKSILDFFQ